MADRAFQVSGKLPDGRIFVVGADSYLDFANNLTDALGQEDASVVLKDINSALLPNSIAAGASRAASGPAPMTPVEVAAAFNGTITSDAAIVVCKHGEQAKLVPAGVSKSTGKPYRAFYACARPKETQCDFRANG